MTYTILTHKHRFAAWAASRAASVKGCRFSVQTGETLIKSAGLDRYVELPDLLPDPKALDSHHRVWRESLITAAETAGLRLSHGVAAKLINMYFKGILVCGGHHRHAKVEALHPPIDGVLLDALVDENFAEQRARWLDFARIRWSKFDSHDYESLIALLKESLSGQPLWSIEKHWRGYQ